MTISNDILIVLYMPDYFHDFRIFFLPHHFRIFNVLFLSLKLLFRLLSCICRFTSEGKRAYRVQPVNYRSFNEWNCAPSWHPRRFLLSILTWRIDTVYLALPRGSTWRLRVATSSTVSFSNAWCASATALLVVRLLAGDWRGMRIVIFN